MKLVFSAIIGLSLSSFATSKVVEKYRIVDEKITAATGCEVTGRFNTDRSDAGYGAVGYVYTATMKINVTQKIEAYSVLITKNLFGKVTETTVPSSSNKSNNKSNEKLNSLATSKTISKTQSITKLVRYPDENYRLALQKACEDEMQFINTGAYPPPPPKPVVVEVPKTQPAKPPATPTVPSIPGLPTSTDPVEPAVPGLPDPGNTTIPGLPSGDSENPLFPIAPVPVKK